MPQDTQVAIVGAGMAGLSLADGLNRAGVPFELIEARARLGGRVKRGGIDPMVCDLGPSWFWRGQPRMTALVGSLGLKTFEQFTNGNLAFEDEVGQVRHDLSYAAMAGSLRIEGGMAAVTEALGRKLPAARVHTNSQVVALSQTEGGMMVTLANNHQFKAQYVVLCLPPRLAAALSFDPVLPTAAVRAMRSIPTWMAGQAKLFAVYDIPFWRQLGLSGDGMSRLGPLVEIHDASAASGTPAALFGFFGVSPANRRQNPQALKTAAVQQMTRLFGPQAAEPREVILQDWSDESFTSTALDHQSLGPHPVYGLPTALAKLAGGRLIFGGTETAVEFGGFLEGALERSAQILAVLQTSAPRAQPIAG